MSTTTTTTTTTTTATTASNALFFLLSHLTSRPFQVVKFGVYSFGEWLTKTCRSWLVRVLAAGPVPDHIAFIMDGNRRFADRNGMQRIAGHVYGYNSLMKTLEICFQLGIKVLTVYAFSVDNFKRPPDEVNGLMDLLREKLDYLLKEAGIVRVYNLRIRILGDLSLLPPDLQVSAERVMNATRLHSGPIFNICLAYDSQLEMLHSAQHIFHQRCNSSPTPISFSSPNPQSHSRNPLKSKNVAIRKRNGRTHSSNETSIYSTSASTSASSSLSSPSQKADDAQEGDCSLDCVTVTDVENGLYTRGCPSVDLLVRTSGEGRLSKFLQWQCSNAQLLFCDVLWPEFRFRHIFWCLLQYQSRCRTNPILKTSDPSSLKET